MLFVVLKTTTIQHAEQVKGGTLPVLRGQVENAQYPTKLHLASEGFTLKHCTTKLRYTRASLRTEDLILSSTFNKYSMTMSVESASNCIDLLLYAGFEEATAKTIMELWEIGRLQPGRSMELLVDTAVAWVEQLGRTFNGVKPEDDCDEALKRIGIAADERERILDPKFDKIRLTRSASSLVVENLEESYNFFHKFGQPGTPIENIINSWRRQSWLTWVRSLAPVDSPEGPNFNCHTTFYFAGTVDRVASCFRYDDSNQRSFDPNKLRPKAPHDFNPWRGSSVRLIEDSQFAPLEARYLERRMPWLKVGIFQIAIPKEHLLKAKRVDGEDWKTLVWHSRHPVARAQAFGELPPEMRGYQDHDMLVGPVCGNSSHAIAQMNSKDELTPLDLGEGKEVRQLLIQSVPLQRVIAEACKGCVWMTILD